MDTMSPPRKSGMTAEEFKALLKAASLKQYEAADLLGITRRTINRWATGAVTISVISATYVRSIIKAKKKRR